MGADLTDYYECYKGLKQGEICTVLFSLFINEFTNEIHEKSLHGIQLSLRADPVISSFICRRHYSIFWYSDRLTKPVKYSIQNSKTLGPSCK